MLLGDEVIQGSWKEGKLHGQGQRRLANGDLYRGKWIEGKLTGFGEYITREASYAGHFYENRENGRGKRINHVVGYVYDGEFKEGYYNGMGK